MFIIQIEALTGAVIRTVGYTESVELRDKELNRFDSAHLRCDGYESYECSVHDCRMEVISAHQLEDSNWRNVEILLDLEVKDIEGATIVLRWNVSTWLDDEVIVELIEKMLVEGDLNTYHSAFVLHGERYDNDPMKIDASKTFNKIYNFLTTDERFVL